MVNRRFVLAGVWSIASIAGLARASEPRLEVLGAAGVVPPALEEVVEPSGQRAIASDGIVAAEVFLAKQIRAFEDGAFVGVLRLPEGGHDVRERAIPAGTYSLRYTTIPAFDRHDGCMRSPQFLVLIPVSEDTDPLSRLTYDEMVTLSAKTLSRRHPVVWQMQQGRGSAGAPSLREERQGPTRLTLSLALGSARVPLVLFLRGFASR